MQKAMKWLDAKKIKYHFHNYKESGIDKATIENWLKYLPLDKVVNLRSATYKELPDSDKANVSDKAKAIKLMMAHNSLIKRPVWDFGNGQFFLGWDEKELSKLV